MMAGLGNIPGRLYRGEMSVRIVQRQKMWYAISGLILVISIIALLVRGLNFSVEFKGGSIFQFPATTSSASVQNQINGIVSSAGGGTPTVQHISGISQQWQVQTGVLSTAKATAVENALEKAFSISPNKMVVQLIGPTWSGQVIDQALKALIIFLVVIVIYLWIAFEWKMAVGAFVALLHDILITIGVYALIGFQVSPTTIIGLLTILGYSLYDTVVVFDKVRENTAGLLTTTKTTYTEAANLALNQTLVRSINTSLTALLPVAAMLFIGGALLGTGTLNDLSLVLFVGMLSGTYSSLGIATPVLADLKEREPRYRELAEKVRRRAAARGTRAAQAEDASAASAVDEATGAADSPEELAGTGDEVTVASPASAGSLSTRPSAGGTRPGTSRQQPRHGGSAQRRPGARRKRR
jgi:preprotein translocase subunit SecF